MANKEKKALGKGLDALLTETDLIESEGLQYIDIDKIVPNPNQPREKILNIDELAASIKEKGILQPIVVTPIDKDSYEIIAGERRWRAAKLAGLEKIPAIVRRIDKNEKLELALIENIQRENLNPVEEAQAYKILIEKFNLTQEELAKRVGKDRSTIANSLRLLNLPNKILQDLKEGRLQPGHVRPLINIKNPNLIFQIRDKIINEKLSVRETEELVKKYKISNVKTKSTKTENIPPELMDYLNKLREYLGTKVKISGTTSNGKIIIEYYSEDDIERIMNLIIKE